MTAPNMTTTDGAGTIGGDTVKTAFDRAAFMAFRAANIWRAVADVQWDRNDPPMPGNQVTFTIITAIAPQTSALSETADPTHTTLADTQRSISLVEYGATVKPTKKLRLTSFLDLDIMVPMEVAANMEESTDIIARDVLVAGTNVVYGGAATSRVTVAAGHTADAGDIRRLRAELAATNTPPPGGSPFYVAYLHPDVSFDLQSESGQQAWSAPHVYSDPQNMYTGELGALGGVRLVENANARIFVDAGVGGTVDVYSTVAVGMQGLGEAVGEPQHIVISGPFDDLQRFVSIGWYGLLGYGIIRQNSVWRLETSSSIGAN